MKGWVGLVGWSTADNGYLSAAGQVETSESSPVRDQHSTTEPPNRTGMETPLFTTSKIVHEETMKSQEIVEKS